MGCNHSARCEPRCSSMQSSMEDMKKCSCGDPDFPESWVKCTEDGKEWSRDTHGNFNGEAPEETSEPAQTEAPEETFKPMDDVLPTDEPTLEVTSDITNEGTSDITDDVTYGPPPPPADDPLVICFNQCFPKVQKECNGVTMGQPDEPPQECLEAIMPCLHECVESKMGPMGPVRSLKAENNTPWAYGVGAFLLVSLVVAAMYRVSSGSEFKEPLMSSTAQSAVY